MDWKPYYGDEAGNKLASLLREHIELAVKVADSAKTVNQILRPMTKAKTI